MASITINLPPVADTWEGVEPAILAGHFRVVREAGRGGGGQVFAAVDCETEQVVALKLLHHPLDRRVEREIAALRALNLPGVVALREVLEHEGHPILVMDLIDGTPFPGDLIEAAPSARWRRLLPTLVSLLETLAQVHEAGIVHRDLKPGNVLVRPDGRAVLLDFGLARGRALGSTITRRGTVLGTPRYLAPEVLTGLPADGRTDLYALGVMLFEALADRPPHGSEEIGPLIQARLHAAAPSIGLFCPELPRLVTDLVDALLQRDPERRPPSARAALDWLGQSSDGERLPWLGAPVAVEDLLAAALAGRPAAATGLPGSGRSRALREVAVRLRALGRSVFVLQPAARPFESLAPHLDPEQTRAAPAAALRELLSRGVILADDRGRLDRWSRAALDATEGPILWGATPADVDGLPVVCVPLPRLSAEQLQALFHGPDRFLHLREDGAAALHWRSLGLPARVEAVLGGWIHQGLATWDHGKLRIARDSLDRLAGQEHEVSPPELELGLEPDLSEALAWILLAGADVDSDALARARGRPSWEQDLVLAELEHLGALARLEGQLLPLARPAAAAPWAEDRRIFAHAALARALPVGSPARLRHLLAAEELGPVGSEALILARRLWQEGRSVQARSLLSLAGEAVALQDPSAALPLAHLQLRLALAEGTSLALHHAELLLKLAGYSPVLDDLLDAARRPSAERFAALKALGPLPEEELEICRASLLVQCGRSGGAELQAELVCFLDAWELAGISAEAAAMCDGWRGLLAYTAGRFEEATQAHARSLKAKSGLTGRLSSLLNLASSRMEQGELEAAVVHAEEALDLACTHRQPLYEARALLLSRRARERLGQLLEPDPCMVEEARLLGSPGVAGLLALGEAYIARRAALPELTGRLGAMAGSLLLAAGNHDGALIAAALQAGAGEAGAWGARERERAALARGSVRTELDRLLGGLAPSSGEAR